MNLQKACEISLPPPYNGQINGELPHLPRDFKYL